MISGIFTATLMALFIGVAVWAYSARNRARFDDAAQLPLHDEVKSGECGSPTCCGGCGKPAGNT